MGFLVLRVHIHSSENKNIFLAIVENMLGFVMVVMLTITRFKRVIFALSAWKIFHIHSVAGKAV